MFNQSRFLKALSIVLMMISAPLFAGGEVPASEPMVVKDPPFFIKLGAGASFSSKAHVCVDTRIWDVALNGYNATLRNSEGYELGLGYWVSPLWFLEIAGSTRPSYQYEKFQQSLATNTPGFLGDKTRFFKLTNRSILFNLGLDTLNLSDRCVCSLGQHPLRPIFGAGIGIAYNTVKDFHSQTLQVTNQNPVEFSVASIMNPYTRRAFAYQLMAGLRLTCVERFNLDVGYRYFDGGRFSTNTYVVDTGVPQPMTVPAWKGRLRAHEVFVNLSYALG